mmetsp:Transcript_13572/g.36735  ORF Transcript_13572/g.36735 Transcript_13572/m.36735 type:complete len:93 (+) Transcript_13572:1082-1360(+)
MNMRERSARHAPPPSKHQSAGRAACSFVHLVAAACQLRTAATTGINSHIPSTLAQPCLAAASSTQQPPILSSLPLYPNIPPCLAIMLATTYC